MKKLLTILFLLPICVLGQGKWDIGVEVQAYPTGIIPGLRLDLRTAPHHAFHVRAGYQWIRHRDLGVHQDERGQGGGGTLGYRYYFDEEWKNWFLGFRNDLWFNSLDWRDNIGNNNELSGQTDIIVVQPTIEGGLANVGKNNIGAAFSLAFGYEWNVKTEGEPTGQGAILLIGAHFFLRK